MERIALRLAVIVLAALVGAVLVAPHLSPSRPLPVPDRRPEDAMLRRMVGQMLLVGFAGSPGAGDYGTVLRQAKEGAIGGVIYLGRNIRSLDEVRLRNEELQRASALPLFIAVDQEGGRVERLTGSVGFREIPGAAAVSGSMSPLAAGRLYENLASALFSLGFNLNLGPVVDLDVNPANPIISRLGRSFSDDPQHVEAYARAFVQAHRAKRVLTALKHFPGHGSSAGDTHDGAADVTRTWDEAELLPYRALIASGDADMVMSAHVINGRLSSGEYVPASLSRATLTGVLRGRLGFRGVVISDDMQMAAIEQGTSLGHAVRQAVLAGNDILLFANDRRPDPMLPGKVADLLIEEARRNPEMLDRIRESHANVMRLKERIAR